jgi:SCF-associated factor 1
MTLDEHGRSWLFTSWGRSFRLTTALLDCTSPDSTPVQVECGWAFSAVLTQSGDVYVLWPFSGLLGGVIQGFETSMNDAAMNDQTLRAHAASDGTIPCITRDITLDPMHLPPIPVGSLPDLQRGEEDVSHTSGGHLDTYLVRIAGLDCHLIGLTNKGHVLKFGHLENAETAPTGRWEYVRVWARFNRGGSAFISPLGFF